MTNVALSYPVECPPERVRALMLDEAFLHAFVDEQHPTAKAITVDRDLATSVMSWSLRLDGELPALVTRFVGNAADLRLVFDLGKSTIEMTAIANRTGTLACDLRIDHRGGNGSVMHIVGRLRVTGAFGGLAEGTVRDQVVEPVFREDLVRLLNEWGQSQPR